MGSTIIFFKRRCPHHHQPVCRASRPKSLMWGLALASATVEFVQRLLDSSQRSSRPLVFGGCMFSMREPRLITHHNVYKPWGNWPPIIDFGHVTQGMIEASTLSLSTNLEITQILPDYFHRLAHCLPHYLPLSLPHYLLHCLSDCLPHYLPHCLPHCLPYCRNPTSDNHRSLLSLCFYDTVPQESKEVLM